MFKKVKYLICSIFMLEKIVIEKIIWNRWSLRHIGKHGITKSEIEEVIFGKYITLPTYNERILMIGKTSGDRVITIVLNEEESGHFFVITAFNSSNKQINKFNISKEVN